MSINNDYLFFRRKQKLSRFAHKNFDKKKPKVDIIYLYENLTGNFVKRRGVYTMVLCPFHNDTHPSCALYSETNSFYCFVCNEGGDAFTLIQKIKKCEFNEALKIARKYEK